MITLTDIAIALWFSISGDDCCWITFFDLNNYLNHDDVTFVILKSGRTRSVGLDISVALIYVVLVLSHILPFIKRFETLAVTHMAGYWIMNGRAAGLINGSDGWRATLTLLEHHRGRSLLNRHACVMSAWSLLFSQHCTWTWHSIDLHTSRTIYTSTLAVIYTRETHTHMFLHKVSTGSGLSCSRQSCWNWSGVKTYTCVSTLTRLQYLSLSSCMSMYILLSCLMLPRKQLLVRPLSPLSFGGEKKKNLTCTHTLSQSYLWDFKTGSATCQNNTSLVITLLQWQTCCPAVHNYTWLATTFVCRSVLLKLIITEH